MRYYYTLTKKDIKRIGLEHTESNEYEVEQSGWTGVFYSMYEIVENECGKFKNKLIVRGEDLTSIQIDYIFKNCKYIQL